MDALGRRIVAQDFAQNLVHHRRVRLVPQTDRTMTQGVACCPLPALDTARIKGLSTTNSGTRLGAAGRAWSSRAGRCPRTSLGEAARRACWTIRRRRQPGEAGDSSATGSADAMSASSSKPHGREQCRKSDRRRRWESGGSGCSRRGADFPGRHRPVPVTGLPAESDTASVHELDCGSSASPTRGRCCHGTRSNARCGGSPIGSCQNPLPAEIAHRLPGAWMP